MIRSIDIHTGHYSPLDTDVVVLSETACVLRLHIGGATVNIFGDLSRQAEIEPPCPQLANAITEFWQPLQRLDFDYDRYAQPHTFVRRQ